jgi:GMP reductase
MHKHYSPEEWALFRAECPDVLPFVAVSAGSSEGDLVKLSAILAACPEVAMICLDVANGYSEAFVEAVQRTRKAFPTVAAIRSLKESCAVCLPLLGVWCLLY